MAPHLPATRAIQSASLLSDHAARRRVSLVRMEIPGFPSLVDSMAADVATTALSGLLEALTKPVIAQNGVVLRQVGCGVLIAWNTPVNTQPDHAQRALIAARQAFKSAAAAGQELGLLPHGSVVTGLAIVGNVGSRYRRSFEAIGSIVRLAENWCEDAAEGVLYVAKETLEEAGERIPPQDEPFVRERL